MSKIRPSRVRTYVRCDTRSVLTFGHAARRTIINQDPHPAPAGVATSPEDPTAQHPLSGMLSYASWLVEHPLRRQYTPRVMRDMRKALGLDEWELGRTVGRKARTISAYEYGHRIPGADFLGVLADALGCSVDDFFTLVEGVESCPEK